MARFPRLSTRPILATWAIFGLATLAQADPPTPLPEYTGERVYVSDVPDRYDPVRLKIRQLERSSPQTYFVVVIRTTGEGAESTRDALDRLFEQWLATAKRRGLKLDPERSVIVLVALEDRKVAVRVGTTLQERLGLRRGVIERDLVQPIFVPKARAGDEPGAITALLEAIDKRVVREEQAVAARGEVPSGPSSVTGGTPARAPGDLVPAGSRELTVPPLEEPTPAPPPTVALAQPLPRSAGGESAAATDWRAAVVGSLLAVGLIVGGLIWLARHRTRKAVERRIKQYRSRSVEVMDQLDALKERLKLLPASDPDFREPMAGETLALYQQVGDDLEALWSRWLEIMEALNRAQELAAKGSPIGRRAVEAAGNLVSDPKVFDELESESKRCAEVMDRLNSAHEAARAVDQRFAAGEAAIEAGFQLLGKEGLPLHPYQPQQSEIAQLAAQARRLVVGDPIGAMALLEQAVARSEGLRNRIDQVLQLLAAERQLESEQRTLRDRITELRRQGWRLDEPEGNPDQPLARADEARDQLHQAVTAGDPEEAAAHLESARAALTRAKDMVEAVVGAKAWCQSELPQRRRETLRLREALPQFAMFLEELRREFAPESWQAVAGNLDQARILVGTFDRKADEADRACSDSAQQYLLGRRLLSELSQEQQVAFRLMSAVGEALTELRGVRQECQQRARELEDRARAVRRLFDQNRHAIGKVAAATLARAEEALRPTMERLSLPRPDWPSLRHALAGLLEEFAIAGDEAQSDLQTYRELSTAYEHARQEADRIGNFLSSRSEDRPAANQHFQKARQILARIMEDSTRDGAEWARLLEQTKAAVADLNQAERMARQDIQLARQAEAELEEARRVLREARSFSAPGIRLDPRPATDRIAQAERHLRTQEYEQAVRLAGLAIEELRQAHQAAAQQAYWQQMQAQADQRRRAVAGAAAIGAAGGLAVGRGAVAAGSPPTAVPPLPQDAPPSDNRPETSSTASGSWSTETTETSW